MFNSEREREQEAENFYVRKEALDRVQLLEPGKFHKRRIPGTLSLAISNLLISGLLIDTSVFDTSALFIITRTLLPAAAWGTLFLMSSVFLLLAVFTRKLLWLNIGATISLFSWIVLSGATLNAWIIGEFTLSPVSGGLFFWMVFGQLSMLLTPLLELKWGVK